MQPADKSRHYLKAAAIGGAAGGVLMVIPFVNCLCCLWVLGAGFLAVYLVQQWSGQSVTPGEGATVGALAGVIEGFVSFILVLPFTLARGGPSAADLQQLPEQARRIIEPLVTSGVGTLVGFVMSLVLGTIFGTLGGLLGAAILRRREQ